MNFFGSVSPAAEDDESPNRPLPVTGSSFYTDCEKLAKPSSADATVLKDLFKCYICFDNMIKPMMCPLCSKVGCHDCIVVNTLYLFSNIMIVDSNDYIFLNRNGWIMIKTNVLIAEAKFTNHNLYIADLWMI